MEEVVSVLDRDTTLTGRTNMWADLLKEAINPILGAGYQSFWLGPGAERIWAKYYFHPTQAHNGYLEVYLNRWSSRPLLRCGNDNLDGEASKTKGASQRCLWNFSLFFSCSIYCL